MQELLLRHSTIRTALDAYTQAVTTEKHNAQEAVVAFVVPEKKRKKRTLGLNRLDYVYLFCAFCAHPKMGRFH